MENEFKIDGELFSGNENEVNDPGKAIEVSTEETFDGLQDIIDDFEEPINNDEPLEIKPAEVKPDVKPEEIKNTNEDTTPYQDIVNHYQSKGMLADLSEYEDDDFKFDGSEESFTELMSRKSQKDAFDILYKDILPQLPSSARKAVELLMEEELDADSAEELGTKIDNYSSLNKETFEKDVEKAKATYRTYLKSKGLDDDEVDEAVNTAVDLDQITDKAEKARLKLLEGFDKEIAQKKEKEKIEAQKREEAQRAKLTSMKASISAFKEKINKEGFPVNDKIIEDIYKLRTEIVGQSKDNRPLTKIGALNEKDPEGFQNSLNLLVAMGYFSEDKNGSIKPNFDKLTKAAQSKAVKQVSNSIVKATTKFKSGSTKGQSQTEDIDDDDILSALKQTGQFN